MLSALLMGMASLVLLIACLNLTNMMLARGAARRKEIALRLALGSGRARVIRQLLTESLLLAAVGSVAGLLLATWGASLLVASLASALPFVVMLDTTPDVRVLAATVGFCVLSTIVSGLGPAWRVTRPDVLPDLKEQPAQERTGRAVDAQRARGGTDRVVAGAPDGGGTLHARRHQGGGRRSGFPARRRRDRQHRCRHGGLRRDGRARRVARHPAARAGNSRRAVRQLRVARAVRGVQRIAPGAEGRHAAGRLGSARRRIGCGPDHRRRRLLRHTASANPAGARVHVVRRGVSERPSDRHHRRTGSAPAVRRCGSGRTGRAVCERQGVAGRAATRSSAS